MPNFLSKLLSAGADKDLKEYQRIAAHVNELEPRFGAMDDEELSGQTKLFRERIEHGETLDDLLPEAFAAVREASRRTTGMRHFDVQVIGGIALHRGTIAEMKTGEGKTLVSTLAGYLNALEGKGVHIVTVNDYLAKRDSEWMGQIYRFMGLKVGLLQNGMRLNLKKPAYQADVTYGTNSEFGFDYLRDNMVTRPSLRVQRGHHYAIVDEVDSILIDEARTPLIISGAGTKSAGTYKDFARAVRGLAPDVDFEMDEAKHTIAATDDGLKKIERNLGIDDIYADPSGQLVNHLQQALKAQYMFHRDQQYVVVDGEVKIVDEFTGRIMEGRRYSEGLHQAIEAKEGVLVREENQTLATITLQNYFLMYDKLSGMTGTAMTEDSEFREVYHVPVQVIPPNKPVIRVDHNDIVYKTVAAKFNAVADDVAQRHAKGQPCLVGTVSIENSERLSRTLDKRGIKHNVLNAKYHEREAQIVAQAGREGAVTIATNMAGRGTDILLGGNPKAMAEEMLREQGFYAPAEEGGEPVLPSAEDRAAALKKAKAICEREREHVVAAGGLAVIGTERHESRRIDNQLRGRSGRQGDPGETQFYLSLEDDLMRLFGGDRMDHIATLMNKYKLPDDMPIKSKLVTRAVESAQRKVEEVNFAMRKSVLDYDDVMNKQRQVIYEERNKILDGKDLVSHVEEVTYDTVQRKVSEYCSEGIDPEEWDLAGLDKWIRDLTGRADEPTFTVDSNQGDIIDAVDAFTNTCYREKEQRLGDQIMSDLSAQVMLRVIDTRWMTYLQEMDYLKTGISLRGYGQRDPLVEYKSEAYAAFTELVNTMYEDFLRTILRIEIAVRPAAPARPQGDDETLSDELRGAQYSGPAEVDGDHGSPARQSAAAGAPRMQGASGNANAGVGKPRTYRKDEDPDPYVGVGRNDPCPCGSGKKFKNCHGRNR
ncbi:preprotein translocase subunit SecA [Tractidigestivibacter sp.]|uniref:preprotein translocase subunit SecA n=1 Tax=Tractidigestivibacter sp. TaxID=2847320 RepID=UPI002A909237|nr:preprotein translocase subunit SecA [Tractidigestivibacter sp.]MDY5271458.1 preprotein translocase subunit SecA [Tractidigestivibacter sp.]